MSSNERETQTVRTSVLSEHRASDSIPLGLQRRHVCSCMPNATVDSTVTSNVSIYIYTKS